MLVSRVELFIGGKIHWFAWQAQSAPGGSKGEQNKNYVLGLLIAGVALVGE
jgi:hypothetical protein